jgi:hypothetical protein
MTTDQINLNTQAYRTEAKPRTYVCACGAKAVWRAYDARTGESKNVCQACKGGK